MELAEALKIPALVFAAIALVVTLIHGHVRARREARAEERLDRLAHAYLRHGGRIR